MRFAIIGAGVIGRTHAAAINELGPEAELTLVVDEMPARAMEVAEAHGAEYGTSSAQALDRDDIDAVAICTPSGQHAALAVAALEAGKHIVVEKPLDVTLEAALRVVDAERRSGRTATVISQHRFDAASQLVQRAVQENRFGRLTSAVASLAWWRTQGYYDSGDWRGTWALDGGGALMNQGIHTIDLLVWMLGDPVEVYAQTACLAHERIEVEDTAAATIRFANGALAVVHGTTAAYPGMTARLQIHGNRGSAVIDGDRLEYFHAASGDADSGAYGAGASANQAGDVLGEQEGGATAGADPAALSGAHSDQYRDFVAAVSQGRAPLVTVAEAAKTLAVVGAIYESARTGRPTPVQFDALREGIDHTPA
ncbi:Gfo/Idh/MocA family protein [Streptomyces sp. NBC_00344]|uniref:Gfo/Idh/MocA family protein n=1 Tax=Streptomyces sp. NBC_00344 TaxID=2975720 RepID=UPI002E2331C7